jgi:tetratricopeptide (TPR) repeat protein
VWDNLGLVFESAGNKDKAEESFDFALALNPRFIPAYFDKAEMLLRNNELCRALSVYEELLEEDNSNTKAMCEMGYCYHQMGFYPEALDLYRQALIVTSECSEAWLGLGSVYLNMGKHMLSINMIKKAVLLQPDNADYWFMLGKAYSSARKLNKAILAFTKASELNPYDYDTWMMCAQLLFKKRRISEAISMLQQLLECNNDDPVIHYRLAAYCAYQGNLSAAQKYLKKGLRLNYQEHTEMFRLFPKTRTLQIFRQIIDNNHQHDRVFKKSR